ncbi:hypothetical protein JL720_6261 [Aureococcus anophagefferens]|nr:hypothetical protein JL720_6261 [Aureococcus anophagefferens]
MQHITQSSRRRVEDDDAPKKKLSRRERRRLLEEKEMAKYHRSDWEIMKPYAFIGAKVLAGLLAAYGAWCGLCWLVSTDTLVCACLIVGPFAGVYYVTPPPERPPRARVEEIWVYPVKSCKGVRYYSARLDAQCGLERAPAVEGVDQGATAGKWVSKFLRCRGCRLVRMPDGATRQVDRKYAPKRTSTAFSDGFPLLVAATESLADLNARLEKKKAPPVPMDRFRPNLVVAGVTKEGNAPFAEDAWKTMTRAGDRLALTVAKPCSRCKMPTIDQATGEPDGGDATTDDAAADEGGGPRALAEPTATLKEYRTGAALKLKNPKWRQEVFFGQNITHASPGAEINVGDTFYVRSKGRSCAIS